MKKLLTMLMLTTMANCANSQTYKDSINTYREKYKQDFLEDDHSPLKKDDLTNLRFFDADESFRVIAQFKQTANAAPFDMATMNGSSKKYIEYGTLTFTLENLKCSLKIYQSISLMSNEKFKDYLFLPFMDKSNGNTTYGGGRYLDFKKGDIKDNELVIDFNKAYNSYCAYSSGYSCPKPPADNKLSVSINAGEKEFGKSTH